MEENQPNVKIWQEWKGKTKKAIPECTITLLGFFSKEKIHFRKFWGKTGLGQVGAQMGQVRAQLGQVGVLMG